MHIRAFTSDNISIYPFYDHKGVVKFTYQNNIYSFDECEFTHDGFYHDFPIGLDKDQNKYVLLSKAPVNFEKIGICCGISYNHLFKIDNPRKEFDLDKFEEKQFRVELYENDKTFDAFIDKISIYQIEKDLICMENGKVYKSDIYLKNILSYCPWIKIY